MRRILTAIAFAIGIASAGAIAPASAVVNGSDAITNPGAVSIYTDNPYRNRCTGALVGPKHIITAAHCYYAFTQPTVTSVEVRIGSIDNTTGYISRGLASNPYTFPSDFDPNTNRSDIMVVELDWPVSGVPMMKYNVAEPTLGAITKLYGWGWTCDGPPGLSCSTWYAGLLQTVNLKSVPDTNCFYYADPRHACLTSATTDPRNACLGDSGGLTTTKGIGSDVYGRYLIIGDGDANVSSCLYGPNGTPGLTLALAVGDYREFITDAILDDIISGSAPAVSPTRLQELLAMTG